MLIFNYFLMQQVWKLCLPHFLSRILNKFIFIFWNLAILKIFQFFRSLKLELLKICKLLQSLLSFLSRCLNTNSILNFRHQWYMQINVLKYRFLFIWKSSLLSAHPTVNFLFYHLEKSFCVYWIYIYFILKPPIFLRPR